MEQEVEGISLFEIFKKIWRQKIITVAVALVVIIVGVIISLLMGKGSGNYQLTATYEFPGLINSRYADGTTFDYQDIVGLNNLKNIKDSNSDFVNIDVDKMIEKNDFIITGSVDSDNLNRLSCSFSVKESYFKSKDLAKKFITAVVETPYNRTLDIANSFTAKYFLEQYSDALEYDIMVNYFEKQGNYLLDIYEDMIETYGDQSIDVDSKLSTHKTFLETELASDELEIIRGLQAMNGYVNDPATISERVYKKQSLENEKINNEGLIAKYQASLVALGAATTSEAGAYTQHQIADLILRNFEIQLEIDNLDKLALGHLATESFKKLINDYYDKLVALSEDCTKCIKTVYTNSTNVSYKNASMVVYSSNTNKLLIVFASIIFGAIVGSATGLVVDIIKNNKKKEKKDEKEKCNNRPSFSTI